MTGDSRHTDTTAQFAARQYAHLIDSGCDAHAARERLSQVLGEGALDVTTAADAEPTSTPARSADLLVRQAHDLGGDGASARAALATVRGNMHLFALDWWRPIRSFVLYALVLLAMAVALAIFFMVEVLPNFARMDQMTGVGHNGAASQIMAIGGLRLFLPLVLTALLLALFVLIMVAVRRAMSAVRPLPGASKWPWLYGRSGHAHALMLRLDRIWVLLRARVPLQNMPDACRLIGKDMAPGRHRQRFDAISGQLQQAAELGTFDSELDWQRRQALSHLQTRWELSRDRLILLARILFYLIIGYLIAVLYLPIFTLAMHVGPHL